MAHRFLKLSLVCMAIIASTDLKAQQAPVLWYDSPAEYWEEALPLGNGRLGAMVYGNPVNEEIQLNEETISAGAPYKNYNPENILKPRHWRVRGFSRRMVLACLIKQQAVYG